MTDRPQSTLVSSTTPSTNMAPALVSSTTPSTNMAPAEVTTLSIANGRSVCAATGVAAGEGSNQPGLSLRSVTLGLWQLAISSVLKIASIGKKGAKEVGAGSNHKALPPLPAVPPVGPGGRCRPRSLSVSDPCAVRHRETPPLARRRGFRLMTLARSQSMADIFTSVMGAVKFKHKEKLFARSTHCQECNHKFSLIFRRHHCRSCQRSVCAYCSNYQKQRPDSGQERVTADSSPSLDATDNATTSTNDNNHLRRDAASDDDEVHHRPESTASLPMQGILHRVCRRCTADREGKVPLYYRNWTEEFCCLRRFFKQGRSGENSRPSDNCFLPPRIPRVPPECEALAATFVEEYKKSARNSRTLFQATSASFNAGLQYALKTPSQKPCATCCKLLRFPVDRKTCVLCKLLFCQNCSSRDLVLTLPHGLDPGDVVHEMAQVAVKVLTEAEADELDSQGRASSISSSSTVPTPAPPSQRYRLCHKCRDSVTIVQMTMTFNDKLAVVQAELMDLQQQIAAVVDEQDMPSPGSGVSRWPSVLSVHQYTSAEDEMVGEAVNQRVANKLLDRFFCVYLELERLQPQTLTQGVLFKHVKQAMTSFYMIRRSVSSKRFSKNGVLPSLPRSDSASLFL